MSEGLTERAGGIAIAGSGQAAWSLGLGLKSAGISVTQVWARHSGRGRALANSLDTEFHSITNSLGTVWTGDVLLMAVSDQAIAQVADQFICRENQHIIHCAGTLSMEILAGHPRHGVLWPVMNLSQPHEQLLQGVPILIETNHESLRDLLQSWCHRLRAQPVPSTLAQRIQIHLAAVMTANFNNLLLHWGHKLLLGQGEHALLMPILREQLRLFAEDSSDPFKHQSGPAHRGDTETMNKHLALLEQDPEGQALYRTLSAFIAHLRSNPSE
jgi:predicted short-subunit dehydrogenase-like oxidoreductase (DUF2520 family)